MEAVSLTLFLAAGFIFVHQWRITRIMSLKEGHAIYLASVVAAVPIFLVSAKVCAALQPSSSWSWVINIRSLLVEHLKSGNSTLFFIAIISLPVAWFLSWLFNRPIEKNQNLSRFLYEEFGDCEPLDLVISEATAQELPLLITLANGKVYLGYSLVSELYGKSGSQWLHVAPWLSGYRMPDHKLQFTTPYLPVAWRESDEELLHDERFQIAIPLAAVSSVMPFDMEIYSRQFSELSGSFGSSIAVVESASQTDTRAWHGGAKVDVAYYWTGFALLAGSFALVHELFYLQLFSGLIGAGLLLRSGYSEVAG